MELFRDPGFFHCLPSSLLGLSPLHGPPAAEKRKGYMVEAHIILYSMEKNSYMTLLGKISLKIPFSFESKNKGKNTFW